MTNYPTSDSQFLAQVLIATREGDQLSAQQATRLQQLAAFGRSNEPLPTSMPEERREAQVPPSGPLVRN